VLEIMVAGAGHVMNRGHEGGPLGEAEARDLGACSRELACRALFSQ
jgi:hypothetical protein